MQLNYLITLIVVSVLISSTIALIQVNPDTQDFIDEYGRVRIFHGVNVVYKIPPYLPNLTHFDPQNSLTDQDLDDLHRWGFNVIRLYTSWMGINPISPDEVDRNYLSQLSTIISMMESKGLYAILDCHQDVFSRFFCGEGVPDWASQYLDPTILKQFPFPLPFNITRESDTGYPNLEQCLQHAFPLYYLTQGVIEGFKMLYTNRNSTLDSFGSFWRTIATEFANRTSVLGYELLNEPSFSTLADAIRQGVVDRTYLTPMYKYLHQTIRQIDDQHMIFFEPCVFDIEETGFTEGPGGSDYNNRQVLSYHNYCFDVTKQGDPKSGLVCDVFDTYMIGIRVAEVRRKKLGGMMLTEFGAISNSSKGIEELNRITGLADDLLQSWTYWQFKKFADFTSTAPNTTESFYDQDGELEVNKVRALSRSYAQAIAGQPITMIFNPNTSQFRLQFIINTGIQQPTMVYINEDFNYPQGVRIAVDPKNTLNWKLSTRNYYEFLPTSTVQNGTIITIEINPDKTH